VPAVRERFPNLRLQLAEEKTEDILRMLRQGRLDAGVLALPVGDEGMEMEILFEEPFVLALPAGHALVGRDDVSMSDLRGAELLLLEEGHCLREHALEVCALADAHERVDFHATSMETLRQMVAADVGITLMPLLAVKPPIAATRNLVVKPFAEPAPRRTIAMVWRSSSALSEFLREFAQSLKALPPGLLEP
jgi:LysR family hydrogen peroxide-inducible transcriptional activator